MMSYKGRTGGKQHAYKGGAPGNPISHNRAPCKLNRFSSSNSIAEELLHLHPWAHVRLLLTCWELHHPKNTVRNVSTHKFTDT